MAGLSSYVRLASGLIAQTTALRWSPPAQSGPTIVDLTNTGTYFPTFADDEDVIINMPETIRDNGANIGITGGRHVRVIGGYHRGRLVATDVTGSIWYEGILIDLVDHATPTDAFVVAGTTDVHAPDVYIQNCRAQGVKGEDAGTHGDCIQAYDDIGTIRIHNFTGITDYQGIFLPHGDAITAAEFSRINMRWSDLSASVFRSLFFIRRTDSSPNGATVSYPVDFVECYAQTPVDGDLATTDDTVWPGVGETIGEEDVGATESAIGARWDWTTGMVLRGMPPGGDFVQDGVNCGLGYGS